jgi:hypothetical protein
MSVNPESSVRTSPVLDASQFWRMQRDHDVLENHGAAHFKIWHFPDGSVDPDHLFFPEAPV